MTKKKELVTENDVKDVVKQWYDVRGAWSYAPIQNGFGVVGIHDRVGCVPVTITPEMVGQRVGAFVSIECKRPGRRKEKDRGMSPHQARHLREIVAAAGASIVCDGQEDLDLLERAYPWLTS